VLIKVAVMQVVMLGMGDEQRREECVDHNLERDAVYSSLLQVQLAIGLARGTVQACACVCCAMCRTAKATAQRRDLCGP
jgi:hypothetical protein